MEQERSRNIAVGLTTLGGLVGLASLMFLFGYVPALLERGYVVSIRYPHASGIHEGSRVRLNGIDVGKVQNITLNGTDGAGVTVAARLQPDVRLPKGITPTVQAPLLGGAATVEFIIEDMSQYDAGTIAIDGSAMLEGEVGSIASKFTQELRDVIAGPAENFDQLTTSFTELSAEWKTLAINLNHLTEQRDPEDVDAGLSTGNLASVLERTDTRLAEMKTAIKNINTWAGDEQLREDFKATLSNSAEASAKLNASITRIEKRLVALADDYAEVAASIDKLVVAARDGEGTVAKLLNDPALYNDLTDSAQRLQKAIDEARLLLEKWKAEGVPVQF
jgi:phospholipid/cholesterol/gamma-HCH transport system substrate-binding protein